MKREITIPDNHKYQSALGLIMILHARLYDPIGYHIMYFSSLETNRRKPREKLYAELQSKGYHWTGTRWDNGR